ncbi:hypothetical protein AYO21_02739 [Fonsecaea monophora]|uniref:Xylanolytic transcriptional activator regulatory domain-containing protein n=1 Tax=Fonsecaea monophora TaxID=254056 RepID=A0A177FHN1_9EURO|nr:hypothetical protein AYO21_02739 [Fonsecaea monophora]OAG43120.1 hypothetical protein AYO21_02739 [Fonsecaea monophora]
MPSRRGTYERRKVRNQATLLRPASSSPLPADRQTEMQRSSSGDGQVQSPNISRATSEKTKSHAAQWESTEVAGRTDAPGSNMSVPNADQSSLASMFEAFLNKQNSSPESTVSKLGIVFFNENSPLTFALSELQGSQRPTTYNAGSHLHEDPVIQRSDLHPPHMSHQETGFLKSRGAFDTPRPEVSDMLLAAFLDRFIPLYSIVDKSSFVKSYREQSLPWILFHAMCFIGATFCDTSSLHRAAFENRVEARRSFYNKAKMLFDLGYETNKVVLLQAVLMLSFWGPQMKSYWNPCSWIGFGVTIAESLGIHRSDSSTSMVPQAKGLLRRLWWTLAVRDAYCAALLGRPFRINMSQCNTDMLNMADFDHESDFLATGTESLIHCNYQIQLAKLSLVLRKIIELRFGPSENLTTLQDLQDMCNEWKARLPPEVDWEFPITDSNRIFATSLRIIFHHHVIFIYFNMPSVPEGRESVEADVDSAFSSLPQSSAEVISSTAVTLMTNSMLGLVPHEIFPGFFIASIVFYRRVRKSNHVHAQMGRAALDNCTMVMNAVRERWDPAFWAIKIFDFLVTEAANSTTASLTTAWSSQNLQSGGCGAENPNSEVLQDTTETQASGYDTQKDILHSIDFGLSRFEVLNEFLLMPSYFGATPNAW